MSLPADRAGAPTPAARADRKLARAWARELVGVLAPEPQISPVPIRLSYRPRLPAALDGTSLAEAAADLSAGCTITRPNDKKPDKADVFYRLTGSRFEVNVNPGRNQTSGAPTAIVKSVKALEKPGRTARLVVCSVTLHPADAADVDASCDIEAVYREVRERQVAQDRFRAERKALGETWNAGFSVADAELTYSRLHGEARKRYTGLQNLLTLLQERSDAAAARAQGTVMPPLDHAPTSLRVALKPETVTGEFPDRGKVAIGVVTAVGPRSCQLDLKAASAGHVVVAAPHDAGIMPPGAEVKLEYRPTFGLRRHQSALRAFLRAEVEGDWVSLARLLIEPAALPDLPGRLEPAFYYNQLLNEEQRAAVTGAVTTPHAYLIQGPPGTGKSTVICEIIRQLAGRGERVLLLASMHVAVDEVLKRAGRQPGITALRLAADDLKVDRETRRFMPEQVAGEFGRIVRQRGSSKAGQWQADIAERAAQQQALSDFAATRRKARVATKATGEARRRKLQTAAAAQQAEQQSREADDAVPRLEEEASDAARLAQDTQAAVDRAAAREDAALQHFEAVAQVADQAAAVAAVQSQRARSAQEQWQAAVRQAEHDIAYEPQAEQALRTGKQDATAALAAAARKEWETGIAARDAAAPARKAAEGVRQAQRHLDEVVRRQSKLTRMAGFIWLGKLGDARRERELAVGLHAGAEARAQIADAAFQAAVKAHVQVQKDARKTQRRNEHELARATQAAARARVTESQRADMLTAAQAAAVRAAELQAQASSLTPPVAEARAVLRAAQQDHARAAAPATAARERSDTLARQLAEARAAQAEAQASAVRTTADAAAAAEHAEATRATAEELDQAVLQAARRAADLLHVDPGDLPSDEDGFRTSTQQLAAGAERLRRNIRLEARWLELLDEAEAGGTAPGKLGDMLVPTANLVCCTTTGIGAPIIEDVEFDTLIVDEASRVVDSEFLIGAVKARRWILVGDEHQLPPYVEQKDEHHLHALAALHMTERGGGSAPADLADAVNRLGQLWVEDEELHQFRSASVLSAAEKLRDSGRWAGTFAPTFEKAYRDFARANHDKPGADSSPEREMLRAIRDHLVLSLFERCMPGHQGSQPIPARLRQRLVEQRRMIPVIAEIVSQPVYQGDYRSPPKEELARSGVTALTGQTWEKPVVFFDTAALPRPFDSREGNGFVNETEAELAAKICRQWELDLRDQQAAGVTVSILTFYQAQAALIKKKLDREDFRVLKVGPPVPIDRIQGQEADLIILSFCRTHHAAHRGKLNSNFGLWLQDLRRLNVACTRARRGLALIGHGPTLRALNGPAQAQEFYRHLFEMFGDAAAETIMVRQFIGTRSSPFRRPGQPQ